MAGDWIKLEHTTPDKPEVIRLAMRLGLDQDAVTGKLLRLWIWADQNCVDGVNVPVTRAFVDRLTGCPGFAEALVAVGWLSGEDGVITLTNFTRHNGETAKARSQSNRRMAKSRAAKAAQTADDAGSSAQGTGEVEAAECGVPGSAPASTAVASPEVGDIVAGQEHTHGPGAGVGGIAAGGRAHHGTGRSEACDAASATFSSQNAQPEKRREEKKKLAGNGIPPAGAGWPASESQARALAASIGADADYVATVWLEHDGTGDYTRSDVYGVAKPIGNFASYVKARWNYRLRRTDEEKALEKTKADLRQARASPQQGFKNGRDAKGQRPGEIPTDVSWEKMTKL